MTSLNPFVIVGTLMQSLLPAPAVEWLRGVVEAANRLLQGSPARAIGYGAALVIYGVALVFDRIPDMTLEQAIVNTGFAVTTLVGIVEAIRKYVFSPLSVAKIVTTPPTAAGPVNAAAAEGVDPELIADELVKA